MCKSNCTAVNEILLKRDDSIFVISVTFIYYNTKKENIKNINGENTFDCVHLEPLTMRLNVIKIK